MAGSSSKDSAAARVFSDNIHKKIDPLLSSTPGLCNYPRLGGQNNRNCLPVLCGGTL